MKRRGEKRKVAAYRAPLILAAVIAGLAAFFMLLPTPSTDDTAGGNSFAVRNVRVFDGGQTLPKTTVLVQDGLIKAVGTDVMVPNGVPVVDGTDKTLLPGLIDAHVHTYGSSRPDALRLGVTTELDMFTDWHFLADARRQRESLARATQADLWSSGMLATAPGGHGTEYGVPVTPLTSPDQAQAWVDARIAEGSDYIKIIREDGSEWGATIPTLSDADVAAVIAAAHRRGKQAVIHVAKLDDARMAAAAGVDGLAHVFMDKPADADFIRLAHQHQIFVTATLMVYASAGCANEAKRLLDDARVAPYLSDAQRGMLAGNFPHCHKEVFETAVDNVRRLHAAGIPILAGTDAGNPGTAHGAALHGELELLVQAGLTPAEALAAATSLPAKHFHLDDRGRIAPGLRADLLLVNGDPTADITASRDIAAVYMNGYKVSRQVPADEVARVGSAPKAPDDPLISDFDGGKIASRYGHGWEVTTDKLRGGASTADLQWTAGGALGTPGALEVSGEIKTGFAFPWAGAMFFPTDQAFGALDYSAKHELDFFTRGDGRHYSVMLFSGPQDALPAIQEFTTGPEWTEVRIPLSAFPGGTPALLRGLAFTAGPAPGKFRFEIDQVSIR